MSVEASGQKVLPAVRNMKDFDKFMKTSYESFVVMDIHVGQLKSIQKILKNSGKKMLLHADLIHGLYIEVLPGCMPHIIVLNRRRNEAFLKGNKKSGG